ncbi:MAG: CehA/McbA family metallohydrolase [Planctomycetota bacterium]|jgi:hypothetical protein
MDTKTFRYCQSSSWFKGNTHIHSTHSDGGKPPEEVARLYAEAGYDFLYHTDHWHGSDVGDGGENAPLLLLDGIELDGRDHAGSAYHVVCLGKVEGLTREMGFLPALEQARAQGAILILAHPQWMGNSMDDALRYGFHGVEVYNHVCHFLNGKSCGATYWDAILKKYPNTLGFAADDAHLKHEEEGMDGGWIMVGAETCTREAIHSAIRAGHFYSSCGPEFKDISWDGTRVSVKTSPVRFIRLVGAGPACSRRGGFEGGKQTEAEFEVNPAWPFARLEIEDAAGKRAWTNPLFVQQQ